MRGHSYIQPNLAVAVAKSKEDQFALRRASSPDAYGNPYDPESLLSGGEIEAGLGYTDHRHWPSLLIQKEAVAGRVSPDEILRVAPRVSGNAEPTYGLKRLSVAKGLEIESELAAMIAQGDIAFVNLDDVANGLVTI